MTVNQTRNNREAANRETSGLISGPIMTQNTAQQGAGKGGLLRGKSAEISGTTLFLKQFLLHQNIAASQWKKLRNAGASDNRLNQIITGWFLRKNQA